MPRTKSERDIPVYELGKSGPPAAANDPSIEQAFANGEVCSLVRPPDFRGDVQTLDFAPSLVGEGKYVAIGYPYASEHDDLAALGSELPIEGGTLKVLRKVGRFEQVGIYEFEVVK